MKLFVFACCLIIEGRLSAQKKLIDHSTRLHWPVISSELISNDGRFVAYKVSLTDKTADLIIQSTDNFRKKEISVIAEDLQFTANSRWFLFRHPNDSIGVLDLLKDSLYYIAQAGKFNISNGFGGQWMAYQTGKENKDLVVMNLFTGVAKRYSDVTKWLFSTSGRILVMQMVRHTDSSVKSLLFWHNLPKDSDTVISQNNELVGNFVFDKSGEKLAFTVDNKVGDHSIRILKYYQSGMDSCRVLVKSSIRSADGEVVVNNINYFSSDGNRVFFYAKRSEAAVRNKYPEEEARVTVKNYLDDSLKAIQRRDDLYLFVFALDNPNKILQLGKTGDASVPVSEENNEGNYFVFENNKIGSSDNDNWRRSARHDIFLVSGKDGLRRLVKRSLLETNLQISPNGKYVIWYDRAERNWFAYNTNKSIFKNITYEIRTALYDMNDHPDYPSPVGLAGWMANDEAVFIYDRHDIWKVDPDGLIPPVNFTSGYGATNNISLRILNFDQSRLTPSPFQLRDTLILAAFNIKTKDNGFFKLPLSGVGTVQILCLEPRMFYFPDIHAGFCGATGIFTPLKAKDKNVYILTSMSATLYPNLYLTNEFKKFRPLTNLAPQKIYNWYTSELIHWKLLNSAFAEGILYKPENFDSKKKYPVIYYYYEKNSDGLNLFIHPEWSDGEMNIPWFVSNGYLVVVPNIYYKKGNPGSGVYSSIISAAKYIARMPWVDAGHMGLQGHSFGGWETNYIITRTSIFKAASSSSGISDIISMYGQDQGKWANFERSQGRMGATPWQQPLSYIENSPIFRADRVSTPLLIMHTTEDIRVSYIQGLQWFNDLTRLGKKVWMLSYEGEDHILQNDKNKLDYSIRLGQFFDYFLKGTAPPKWITEGGDNLELDYSGMKQ